MSKDNRKTPSKTDDELYSLSKKDIKKFIREERRHQEIDRLRDVRIQKRTWNKIFLACLVMNIVFIIFALWGESIFGL